MPFFSLCPFSYSSIYSLIIYLYFSLQYYKSNAFRITSHIILVLPLLLWLINHDLKHPLSLLILLYSQKYHYLPIHSHGQLTVATPWRVLSLYLSDLHHCLSDSHGTITMATLSVSLYLICITIYLTAALPSKSLCRSLFDLYHYLSNSRIIIIASPSIYLSIRSVARHFTVHGAYGQQTVYVTAFRVNRRGEGVGGYRRSGKGFRARRNPSPPPVPPTQPTSWLGDEWLAVGFSLRSSLIKAWLAGSVLRAGTNVPRLLRSSLVYGGVCVCM